MTTQKLTAAFRFSREKNVFRKTNRKFRDDVEKVEKKNTVTYRPLS